MPLHDQLMEDAPTKGFRVRRPRESDMLSNPLRSAFEQDSRDCDEFGDLLAELDRVTTHY